MKNMIKTLTLATLISTYSYANAQESLKNECPTALDRVVFATIGIGQGFVIGGPVGAVWGLGAVLYANEYDGCEEKSNEIKRAIEIDEKKSSELDNKLNSIDEKTNEKEKSNIVEIPSFVNFDYDKYDVKRVNKSIEELNLNNASKITIEGHTDSAGTDEYNYALGIKRANAVKKYLIEKNVSSSKLSVVSYGESSPISENDSENRRVDLKIDNLVD